MATNNITLVNETPIILADSTDYAPGASSSNNFGSRTDQLDLTSLGVGLARQSAKFDFAFAGGDWSRFFNFGAAIEYATAPAGPAEDVSFYLGFSNSPTAGMANPAGLTGSDAAYTGYSSNLADSLQQLTRIGVMPLTVQATTIIQVVSNIGVFMPPMRYGILVVVNNSAADLFQNDAVEMSVFFTHITEQIQAAV